MEILTTIAIILISTLVTVVIKPWLEAQKFKFLETIKYSVTGVLTTIVNNLLEKKYPEIAKRVVAGVVVGEDAVKSELKLLGDEAITLLIEIFRARGFDLEALFGKTMLQELLRSIVDDVKLFPGKSTASQLADKEVANAIVTKGLYEAAHPDVLHD